MDEIEQCTASTSKKQVKASKGSSSVKDKHIPGLKKHLQEASRMEAAAAKRMQDLMRQFGTILNQASCLATLCFSCLDLWVFDLIMNLFPLEIECDVLHDFLLL